jgi:hypothetical protein
MAEVDAGAVAPVVNAPAADAVPAPDAPVVTENAEVKDPVQPRMLTEDEHKELVEKRVNERLSKERRRLEREARTAVERDYLKQQLEARNAPADQPPGKPQYKDYEGRPEEFVEALAEWKFEQREAKRADESKAQAAKRAEAEEGQYVVGKFAAAESTHPGLLDRMSELPGEDLTRPMVDFVVDAEGGFAVGDFLASNPKEASRIARLAPIKQVLELDKIAKRLSAPPEITKTPSPIKPNGSTSAVEKPWDELTQAEYNERRRRQQAQLRR